MEKKCWIMLENNPEVMTRLATTLGASPSLEFHDIYSLSDPSLLSHIPRPALALLAIIPLTPAWNHDRQAEDAQTPEYTGHGPSEPVIWFKQTIGHACGSIGLLHSVINGPAAEYVLPGSDLAGIRDAAVPLRMEERAQMLYDCGPFEAAHKSVEQVGDTAAFPVTEHVGQHFVAFVKAAGRLWELEGSRKGPIDRGGLEDDEDVLSPRALELGLKRMMRLEESGGGDLRFSCIALAQKA
ncbi:ubiquitin carboxyl-terminal hydrolase [Aspergillus ellipticus CBS 707.79]|uniref:Ubiquitin carboxyl-terminal hydrolase n=1 Tax=Aspergillus ellipticus CBS 707.79 TaxID=1448320 RepID=A0A319ELH4_9EURO|nr:ubiquitin carboxyl-terminal hydrolase [Aspergillus ellipticus CBS 707.79]